MNSLHIAVIVILCLAAAIIIGARLLTRSDQHRRAQSDFAAYMEAVFMWSEQQDDLSRAQAAMEAVETHKACIQQIQTTAEQDLHISRARRDYLEEYARLQRRHNMLVKKSKTRSRRAPSPNDNAYITAARFQQAVMSLTRGSQARAN